MENFTLNFGHFFEEFGPHIFQYMKCADIVYSFYDLNARLNATVTKFCTSMDLLGTRYKQIEFIFSHVLPRIGANIDVFVIHANWVHLIWNQIPIGRFQWNLQSLCPNVSTLIFENFGNRDLLEILEQIKGFDRLVKLIVRRLNGVRLDETIETILMANDCRLKSVLFDTDSMFLSLQTKRIITPSLNIEHLTLNLIDCDLFANLLKMIPNVRRLSIKFGLSPVVDTSALLELPSLKYLTDFELHSTGISWQLDNVSDVLCKMPYLCRLTLDLYTGDKRLVQGEDLIRILPSSVIQPQLFILYFSESPIEVNNLFASWPKTIPISYWSNEPQNFVIIHTTPYNVDSISIPTAISEYITSSPNEMKSVKHLTIYGESSDVGILKVPQYFHGLRQMCIRIRSQANTEISKQQMETIQLHLPELTFLRVSRKCELLHLIDAAPTLQQLVIDFNCLQNILNKESDVLRSLQRITYLHVYRISDTRKFPLELIFQCFSEVRNLILSLEGLSIFIDTILWQALEMCEGNKNMDLRLVGSITQQGKTKLREWVMARVDSHVKYSIAVSCYYEWVHISS